MTYAYYSAGLGTVALSNYAPGLTEIVTDGEPRDMVVACDQARRIYGIVGGVAVWKRDYPLSWPRAMAMFQGLLFNGTGTSIEVINARTGYLHRVMTVPNAPSAVYGISVTEHAGQTWVILCFGGEGAGTVRGYTMQHLQLTEAFINPQVAKNPRHAELMAGWVFVCDTFGHRVYGVTLGGAMRDSVAVYFPNHVHMLASNVGLICAEHENRIVRWQYSPTVEFSIEVGAPVAPFNDPTKRKSDIVAIEATTLDPASIYSPRKSLCSEEAQGGCTLYSPNSARLYGTDLLVADTDNHTVKVFRAGSVVTKVSGFNNPVTALLI